jgi:hydrogenase maturation protease
MIMNHPRILIAGIGNIFLGDDAFGVESALALIQRPQPDCVTIREFGIHSHDLAFALCDHYDAVIFIDANPRGKTPGTVSLLELEMPRADATANPVTSGHSLDPVVVLQLAANYGAHVERLFLVGCEPAVLEPPDGEIELSPPVRAAVSQAVTMIEALIAKLIRNQDSFRYAPAMAGHH